MDWKLFFKTLALSLKNTGFIVFFTILPFLLGIFIEYMINPTAYSADKFYSKGEFFIYAVSLISSAYLTFFNYSSAKRFFEDFINKIALVLLVFISCAYASISVMVESVNNENLVFYSKLAFFISIPLFLYAQYKTNLLSPDLGDFRKQEQEDLASQLN